MDYRKSDLSQSLTQRTRNLIDSPVVEQTFQVSCNVINFSEGSFVNGHILEDLRAPRERSTFILRLARGLHKRPAQMLLTRHTSEET
jgi:hypothetical protein